MKTMNIEKQLQMDREVSSIEKLTVSEGLQYKKEEDGIRAIGPLYLIGSYSDAEGSPVMIRELIGFRPRSTGTALSEAVRFLTAVMKKRCTAFLLSDFLDPARDGEEFANALKIAGSKHDLVGIRVFDPREAELPDVGIAELQDAETGRKVWVDTSSAAVRDHYARAWRQRSEAIDSLLKHNRIDTATISTDEDYVVELIKLFKQR